MSDEEKALEIAKKYGIKYDTITKEGKIIEMDKEHECYKSALEMAEYKDDYYYKVITEIVGAAYNSCEDHSKIDEVLKKYKL